MTMHLSKAQLLSTRSGTRQRKPAAADIDSSFRGPAFSPPPDKIPSPK